MIRSLHTLSVGQYLIELGKRQNCCVSNHVHATALESKEYAKALEVQTQLMTTEYGNHGNWITGLKRLIDLVEKASGQ